MQKHTDKGYVRRHPKVEERVELDEDRAFRVITTLVVIAGVACISAILWWVALQFAGPGGGL